MDPRRQADAGLGAQARGHEDLEVLRGERQSQDVAAAHTQRGTAGPRLLHVPGQHESDDEPSRLSGGCR